jgi:hypothetical protein
VTYDEILPHYLILVVGIYFYLRHFDELSSEDESSGDTKFTPSTCQMMAPELQVEKKELGCECERHIF